MEARQRARKTRREMVEPNTVRSEAAPRRAIPAVRATCAFPCIRRLML